MIIILLDKENSPLKKKSVININIYINITII